MTRLFVALNIPEEVKKEIVKIRREVYPDDNILRWERDEKLHLTLKFIGHVKEELVHPIADSLNFIQEYKKFNCSFYKFGFFFKRKEAKILWLGFQIDERIKELADELNKRLNKFSVPVEEREFKAHLTLLRIRQAVDKKFIDKFLNYQLPEKEFTAEEISLFKSQLKPEGSIYTEIKKIKLK